MGDIVFEGKHYKDIDLDAQKVLHALNIHTFRYFPKDSIWMASDTCAEFFNINKFYKITDFESGPQIICRADYHKDRSLYRRIIDGADFASETLRAMDEETYYKVSLSVLEKDENGCATVIGGVVEDFDQHMKQAEIMQFLSSEYASVYSVDFIKDQVTPFRMSEIINENYGHKIVQKPSYESIIRTYIDNEVIDEEKSEMLELTSVKNLRKHFEHEKIFKHDYRVFRNEKPIFFRMKAVNISEGDELTKAIMGFADVDLERREKFEYLAYYDQITNGNNYYYFSETIKVEDRPGYLVSLDVRAFKAVNNYGGVALGDFILKSVNDIIEANVCNIGYSGHVNADHFIFFLALDSEEAVIDILNKISADFDKIVSDNNIPKISPYFGAAKWKPGERVQVAFSAANMAKHRIKDSKDLNYGFYREEDNKKALEIKAVEDAFEDAIKTKQFEVWYQPKYSPDDQKLTGGEALVRWRKPDGSLVSPGIFIPIYEKNGMIRQLDEYVFTTVCRQQKAWLSEIGKTVPISVNLSRASLYNENVVEDYKKIANDEEVDTSMVPIEITESATIDNEDIKDLADRFYEAGFPLHIDDFGTGYSSLSTLNFMKFDTLKLDKSLIDYIGEFGGDRLIKHTVALAKDLGLHVTAEGVENESQVKFLGGVECDNIQGFFFDRPMPVDDFTDRLKNANIASGYLVKEA